MASAGRRVALSSLAGSRLDHPLRCVRLIEAPLALPGTCGAAYDSTLDHAAEASTLLGVALGLVSEVYLRPLENVDSSTVPPAPAEIDLGRP
jgi:hypothetical protein